MHKPQSLPWCEPLDMAAAIDEPYWVLLYSGVKTSYSGRYSYLAREMAERIEGKDFSAIAPEFSADAPRFDNAWFGYLGYGLKDCLEDLTPDRPGWIGLPNLCMMRFRQVYEFDHETKTLLLWSADNAMPIARPNGNPQKPVPSVVSVTSNMTRAEYLGKAAQIIEHIHAGDLYQANLTRKFQGHFNQSPDSFTLFNALCQASPAPYSAFLQLGNTSVLSSSPELFLQIDASGRIKTRPIKGTARRFNDSAQDRQSRETLAASAKDKAENLMIADLMRNDLARSCIPGSIEAESLFEVTSHATIHHMSSTVTGQKRGDCSALDVVCHSFPPGSMTGAPKIKAMQLCSVLEGEERGIYSGAIGYFGGDGSAELSVVIRTLIIKDTRFEFQVGGGIVSDSTPEKELEELLDKARGILAALGLGREKLESL